jgi:hypothetical protein
LKMVEVATATCDSVVVVVVAAAVATAAASCKMLVVAVVELFEMVVDVAAKSFVNGGDGGDGVVCK